MATIASKAGEADISLFGPDELQLHRELLELEKDVQMAIDRIARSTTGTSSSPAVTDKQLQEFLSSLRGKIRDLELLSEEQDS